MGEVNRELLECTKDLLKLIDDGILVRDCSKDDDHSYFIKTGLRLVKVLHRANETVKKENKEVKE